MCAPSCPGFSARGAGLRPLYARVPSLAGTLVIGYGNDLRGDDGAGVRAATRIAAQEPQAQVIISHQLTPELAVDVAAATQVVFIDAYAAEERGARLRIERICGDDLAARASALVHHSQPAQLLSLARRLFGSLPEAWAVGIPAFCCAAGESVSPETAQRIDEAVALFVR
jgi:hydrogenase maturation protease